MQVHLVSAERELFSGEAQAVYGRSLEGEIGILPGHQPALLALAAAPLKIVTDSGESVVFAVHHGFLQMRGDGLTILADTAERAEEIDVERARRRAGDLERELATEQDDDVAAQLARNQARLRAADRA